MSEGKSWRILIARLGLAAVVIIAIMTSKETFKLSDRFRTYLDAAFVFFVVFFAVRLLDTALIIWYARRSKPYPLPDLLRDLILAVIYLVCLFVILKNMLHVNITPFLATSAILTMVLGLAFQGVLSNILSGMSLHFTKSFARGDWVGIGPHEGIVVDTNWRETRLLDRYSNIIVLPNNVVASEKITNFSQPDNRTALTMPFKLSYGARAADVLKTLLEAARDCPEVLPAPAPLAFVQSYDELGVSYLLKFWVTDYARKHSILTEVGRLAWYKMKRNNIDIAVSLGDRVKDIVRAVREAPTAIKEPEAHLKEKEQTYRDLLHSSFLRHQQGDKAGQLLISENEVRALADLIRRSAYTQSEVLFRQGEKGTNCFVVARGKIRGEIVYEEGGKKFVSEFFVGPGGIFGEMSLFTGMPRTAMGIVAEETELLKIRAEDFAVLIERNPALAEEVAEMVSARNEQNRELFMKIKELSEKDIRDGTNKKSILEHLKRFVHGLKKEKAPER
jgi:small-conductance mechanosensitive channel